MTSPLVPTLELTSSSSPEETHKKVRSPDAAEVEISKGNADSKDTSLRSDPVLASSVRSNNSRDSATTESFYVRMAKAVWAFFFEELVLPGDDFTQTLRKVGAVVNVACSPFAAMYGAYWCYLGFSRNAGAGAGTAVQGVMTVLIMAALVINYLLVRRWKAVSNTHITVFMWVLFFPCAGCTFGVPEFGTRILMMWYSILVVLSQTDHVGVQCVASLLVQLVSCYNDAWSDASVLLLIPGARRHGPGYEVFLELAGAVCVATTVVIGVWLQARSHVSQVEAANAAVTVSSQLVTLLQKYDTEAVSALLESSTIAKLDQELVEKFREMNDNLERYRPFLPNYLFLQSDSDDQKEESESEGDVDYDHQLTTPPSAKVKGSRALFSPATPHGQRPGAVSNRSFNDSETTSQTSSSSRRSRASRSSAYRQQYHAQQRLSVELSGSSSGGYSKASEVIQSRAKAVFCLVDCHYYLVDSGLCAGSKVQGFIEQVFSVAAATHASVHSAVGDTIQVTWNATHTVAQPEAKAARFLARLKAYCKTTKTTFAAAACTGPAVIAAVKANRQQAFLLHAAWFPALHAMFTLARAHGACLLDETTHNVAKYEVEARAIDQVTFVPLTGCRKGRLSYHSSFFWDEETAEWDAAAKTPQSLSCSLEVPKLKSPTPVASGSSVGDSPPKALAVIPSQHAWDADSVSADGDSSGKRLKVFEVMQEFKRAEDEWMYQLEQGQRETQASSSVTSALGYALQGHYDDAAKELNEAGAEKTLLLARFKRQLAARYNPLTSF